MTDKKGQVTDDENPAKGDPNFVAADMQAVQDRRAGAMTKSCQYGELDTYEKGSLYSRNG